MARSKTKPEVVLVQITVDVEQEFRHRFRCSIGLETNIWTDGESLCGYVIRQPFGTIHVAGTEL